MSLSGPQVFCVAITSACLLLVNCSQCAPHERPEVDIVAHAYADALFWLPCAREVLPAQTLSPLLSNFAQAENIARHKGLAPSLALGRAAHERSIALIEHECEIADETERNLRSAIGNFEDSVV